MLTLPEIINRIASARNDLTYEAVEKMIRERKSASDGLLTDEGAAYIVASELGVTLQESRLETRVTIKDLMKGANDVTITGRVLATSPVKTFTRSDGKNGKLSKMIIADNTGVISVALWDKNAEDAHQKRIHEDQIVQIHHGYVKEGLGKSLEINLGSRGAISVYNNEKSSNDFPTTKDFFRKIGKLEGNEKYACLIGVISQVLPVASFEKSDNRKGRVRRVQIVDDTGRIGLVLWNEKVDLVEDLKRGDWLQIEGANIREGFHGEKEAHLGTIGSIVILPEPLYKINEPILVLTKINEIKPNMANINVHAKAVKLNPTREISLQSGETGKLREITLMDETGTIMFVVWNDHLDDIKSLSVGDLVLIEGGYAREGIQGVALNLGKTGAVTINPEMSNATTL